MNNSKDTTILIVNDSPDQRELMEVIFQQAGYRVSTASDGQEGFRIAKNAPFDLIISDVIMPDGDGIELCLWIRADEKLRSLPILLVSGLRKDANDVVKGMKGGADDYIELPVDPMRLIARAERLIERKRMEDILRESESHFRSLIENVSDIISVILPDGTILYQSPSLEQVLGFKPEQVIGENIFHLVHNDDKARVADFFRNNMQISATTAPIEYRFRNIRGEWLIFESVGKFIDDATRGLIAVISSRDITERRRAKELIRQSEEKYRTILETIEEGYYEIDLSGNYTFFNNALCESLGYDKTEMLGLNFRQHTDAKTAEKLFALFNEVLVTGQPLSQQVCKVIRKDGTSRVHETSGSLIRDANGEPVGYRGLMRDVTGQRQIENNLLASEERYRVFVAQSFEAIWRVETEPPCPVSLSIAEQIDWFYRYGLLAECNDAMARMYGYERADEIIGSRIGDMMPRTDPANIEYLSNFIRSDYKLVDAETHEIDKDGNSRIISNSLSGMIEDGYVMRVWGVQRDITEQKQVEEKLREREEWMRAILDGSRDGIVIEDGLEIAYINQSYTRLLGYDSPNELVGKPSSLLLPPDEAERLAEYGERRLRGENVPSIYEFKGKHKNGSLIESEGSVSASVIGGKNYIMTAIRDVTERKIAESALEQSERDYRTVFEQAHDSIIIFAPENEIVLDINRRACELYGFSRSEFIGMSMETISKIPENGKDKVKETLELGGTLSFETIQCRKDGTEMFLEINASTITYKGQKAIITINRDITERKRAEQGLRESEENFRALVQASSKYVWMIKGNTPNEGVLRWWANLTGLTFAELEGDGWLTSLHPDDREMANSIWQKAMSEKILYDVSYRIKTKTGEYRHYTVRGVPVFDPTGNFRHWIGTFSDITEQKQAEEALCKTEEQLRVSQKLESVGRLAGGIAHDFNNMLTAINGYSELTLRKLEAGNPLRQNIEEIKKAGERAALLTHQLLAFSRQQILQPVVLDLNEAITDTAKMLERLIGEDIRFETILDPRLGHVTADPGQLMQVIMNLTVNARDAMPKGGRLIIETANVVLDEEYAARHVPIEPGLYVMLAVTDTGSGMSEETRKNIFEPFYTTKESGKGTGLGLATVYGIVKQSSGFVWVESELGVGSTFKIYLPCSNAATLSENSANAAFEYISKEAPTILVVDDEDLVRTLTRINLEECGYKVVEASDGSEALAICLQPNRRIDLVITDVMMPGMGGGELAEKLAEKLPNIQILFTSGYTDNIDVRSNIIKADTNFIQKPFTFESLINKVKEFLK